LLTHGIDNNNDPFEDMLEKSLKEKQRQSDVSLSPRELLLSAKSPPKLKS